MKILVTGHKGFIGSNIYWALRSRGLEVDGYDRGDKLKVIKYDFIIHCAANLFSNFKENIKLTKTLTSVYGGHIVFTSSAAVYGNANNAKETDKLNPFGEYGRAKQTEEELVRNRDKYTILRLSNVYGYNSDHGIYSKLLEGNIKINYPENIRDFVKVDKIVSTIKKIIKSPKKYIGTYNLSSGRATKMSQLYKKLRPFDKMEISNKKVPEISVSVLNNTKIKSI